MRQKLDNYCSLPFIHLAIEANGDLKPCCLAPPYKANNEDRALNINSDRLDDLQNCDDYLSFRQSFLENKKHKYCETCWKQESQGLTSLRKIFTRNFGYLDTQSDDNFDVPFLEIKMGNKCNLKCAICNPENSSPWLEEMLPERSDAYLDNLKEQMNWVKNPETLREHLTLTSRVLHIMGGEPFLEKKNEEFIDYLIEESKPEEITIWYNTNGTLFSERLFEKLQFFKDIKVSISVDDIGERFHFQRYPGKWDVVLKNFEKYNSKTPENTFIAVDICWSLFNVFYIDEIFNYFEKEIFPKYSKLYTEFPIQNHFYSGQTYSLNNLRPSEKVGYRKKLLEAQNQFPAEYSQIFNQLKDWLNSPADNDRAADIRDLEIRRLEQARNLSFGETFPELNDLFFNRPSKQKEDRL